MSISLSSRYFSCARERENLERGPYRGSFRVMQQSSGRAIPTLLRKSAFGLKVPFPVVLQAIASISALPRAEKRFMMAMRIWSSAV